MDPSKDSGGSRKRNFFTGEAGDVLPLRTTLSVDEGVVLRWCASAGI